MQYAAEPDRIAELRAIAESLRNIPREFITTKEDILHFNNRAGKRLLSIADHIDVRGPEAGSRKPPVVVARAGRGARRPAEGQLALCL